jgi:spoIIIJ-associated protein
VSQGGPPNSGWTEVSGRTVEEAIEAGLEALGLSSPDQADIEVLDEPQRGLLGIGSREAKVRVRPRVDKARAALRLVQDVLDSLDLSAASAVSRDDAGRIHIDLDGPNLGILIGRRGETLDALQYLINLAVSRLPGGVERVVLDAGGYRERRRQSLLRLVERVTETVRRTGQEVVLEPMTPSERKIVHLAAAAVPGVRSESRGEDPLRRVVIYPEGESERDGGDTE